MNPDMNIEIRPERDSDFSGICELIRTAFEFAEHTDGDEHNLVGRIRKTPEYILELSLVALCGGRIVGYIMFSRIKIGGSDAVAPAPLAVAADMRKRGIGRRLIEAGHAIAREMGFSCAVVLGEPSFYSASGYVPASDYGISAPFNIPEEYYMVCPLHPAASIPSGTVSYSAAFGI